MLTKIFGDVIPERNDLIYRLVKTRLAKRFINTFIVIILSLLLRLLLYAVISFYIVFNNSYIDFFTQSGISILLYMVNNYIQKFTEHFSDDLYQMTRYLINNYSEENFIRWKNYTVASLLIAAFAYFWLVDINSQIILIYILQYAFCFFVFDVKDNENNLVRKMITYNKDKDKEKEIEKTKEKVYLVNRDDPNTDFVIVDKTKTLPKDILNAKNVNNQKNVKNEIKKSYSGFDIIE